VKEMKYVNPISLYRALLKIHNAKLPPELRNMGNAYVKAEFRLHKSAKPEFVNTFMTQWNDYYVQLSQQGMAGYGKDMDTSSMSPEQLQKLEELKNETRK
jgi:hypothetical protein